MAHPHAEFPLGPFTPYAANPILRPQGDGWESSSVYNPAAIVKDDRVVLLYRAHADDIVSHVGLATSQDGISFERHPQPSRWHMPARRTICARTTSQHSSC